MLEKIRTQKAPAAIGPYSQAIRCGNLIYTSGQIPCDPLTGAIAGDTIGSQARQSLENVKSILEAAGTSCEKVIKTTCFLQDMSYFSEFNEIYAQYFTEQPARSCVAVRSLPKGVLCEVEAIAVLGD